MTNQNTQPTIQLEVNRDGQPDYEYMPQPPSNVEALQAAVHDKVAQVTGYVALQARMASYDLIHGTEYRSIRNELYREKRNQRFEKSIGIVAINEKIR
jgi:hypothetical protein